MLKEVKTKKYHYFVDEHNNIQGEYMQWYSMTGLLLERSYFLNGQYHGEYKRFYHDGSLSIHAFYKKGRYHGEYLERYPNGKIISHCFFNDDKQIHFSKMPYPKTEEDRMYFTLKYNLPLLPVEAKC